MFRNDTACWLWVSVVTRRPWSIALHYSGIWKILICFFTSDSFEHKACDVSVASIQSQYTPLYITLVCKEEEKRDCCHIRRSSGLCVAGVRLLVVYYLMDLRQRLGLGQIQKGQKQWDAFCRRKEHRLKAELCNLLRPQLQVLHVCQLITQHAVYSPFKHTKKVGKKAVLNSPF